MTDAEVTAELVAWGAYNQTNGVDVSLESYRQEMATGGTAATKVVTITTDDGVLTPNPAITVDASGAGQQTSAIKAKGTWSHDE